jgi:citronellyl-CoA dehydrogenase
VWVPQRNLIDAEGAGFCYQMLNNQLIYFRLARLQTKIELLNTLAYEGDEAYADGPDVTRKTSMAMLKSGRFVREVIDSCLQYWGDMDDMFNNLVARWYRDGRLN